MSLKSILARLMRRLRGDTAGSPEGPGNAKCFSDDQQKESAFDTRDRGVRSVRLDRIVGSVGRYQDFDNRFRLKHHLPSERLTRIREAMKTGHPLPPVKLYQIKDEFYVLDGNHRIAAAKELGHDEILARIVEFIPSKNTLENMRYRERAEFKDLTGLSADIDLTEVGQYAFLLDQIKEHQRHLSDGQKTDIAFVDAAADWFKTIYRPMCGIIDRSELIRAFPGRTVADMYAYISVHQWAKGRKRQYGIGVDKLIPNNMEAFRKKMADKEKLEYPEMHRGITAFVLMNIQAKREHRLFEKLYALEEVQEIHSVHGDADMLVKIMLTRDLLISDAEVISQFVHDHIRQLQGVNSTKTLIPGRSRIKQPSS